VAGNTWSRQAGYAQPSSDSDEQEQQQQQAAQEQQISIAPSQLVRCWRPEVVAASTARCSVFSKPTCCCHFSIEADSLCTSGGNKRCEANNIATFVERFVHDSSRESFRRLAAIIKITRLK
jgi:hypothetical protein